MYAVAFSRWLKAANPEPWLVQMVDEWIERRLSFGPPDDAMSVLGGPDDVYAARIERTPLTVTYLVVAFERLIILRELG